MSNSLNPVFGEWYTYKQIGSGTDGKVFSIYKEKYNGEREYSVLKIIRLSDNRNERKNFTDDNKTFTNDDEYFDNLIKKITDNINKVRKSDASKYIVRYDDIEFRRASDGKGRLILLKLEGAKSLAEVTKELTFMNEEILRLGINICSALAKCREFGYIYPNLKPENIMFTQDGRCKLGDFGTFSCLEPAKTSVSYKRTQYYMAPEFIRSGNINCTADTYSLGLILYMLSNRNRLPFTEPYPEKITVNSLNEAVKKRMSAQQLERPVFASDELWSIIRKACNYNPNKRYFSPEQMLSDLKNALENKPFEEPKFDDVYSKSVTESDEDEAVVIPDIETATGCVEYTTPVLSIKEEIQIPDVDPVYKSRKNPRTVRKTTRSEKIPEIKTTTVVRKAYSGKLIATAVIALVMILLFILSLILHNNAKADDNIVAQINCFICDGIFNGGVLYYGG